MCIREPNTCVHWNRTSQVTFGPVFVDETYVQRLCGECVHWKEHPVHRAARKRPPVAVSVSSEHTDGSVQSDDRTEYTMFDTLSPTPHHPDATHQFSTPHALQRAPSADVHTRASGVASVGSGSLKCKFQRGDVQSRRSAVKGVSDEFRQRLHYTMHTMPKDDDTEVRYSWRFSLRVYEGLG